MKWFSITFGIPCRILLVVFKKNGNLSYEEQNERSEDGTWGIWIESILAEIVKEVTLGLKFLTRPLDIL